MGAPDLLKVKSTWGSSVARYVESPGIGDLYLSEPKKSDRGIYRLFVPGRRTLEAMPHLGEHPVIFEKHVFTTDRDGIPTTKVDSSKAKEENKITQAIWKSMATNMPEPLGVRNGAFLSAGFKGKALKALIPYVSGRDGITDIGPALFMAAIPGGKEDLLDIWKALSTSWDALSGLHRAGFAHGDAHMSNIMIHPAGSGWKATIIDFSMASPVTPSKAAEDQQILLNHGRVIQAIVGPQRGEYAEMSREQGFAGKPQAMEALNRLQNRSKRLPEIPDFSSHKNIQILPAMRQSKNHTFA